jgi:hypothetical protein
MQRAKTTAVWTLITLTMMGLALVSALGNLP